LEYLEKIGVGGGCHWCTEAIFQSIKGVEKVEQGWITSIPPNEQPSEAVIVHYDHNIINLAILIAIHLHTHSATGQHSMRSKYRSAVYTFNNSQFEQASKIIPTIQNDFEEEVITQILPFQGFRLNQQSYLDYYYSNPEKPFCQTFIKPKLDKLSNNFKDQFQAL